MSEFGGFWKHQNNPACTKSVSCHHVEVGQYTKEEEEEDKFGQSAGCTDTDSIVIYILHCLLLTVTMMSDIVIYILNSLLLTVRLTVL